MQISSIRGTSWYPGVSWDWAPRYISTYVAPPISRSRYIITNLLLIILSYITFDIFDTINHSRVWDTSNPNSVTSLSSIPLQILFSFSVCFCTFLAIAVSGLIYSTLGVALGTHPDAWPPIFDRPFHATSLQDFWTHRWHMIFKRPFDRIALPIVTLIPTFVPRGAKRVIRAVLIFGLSATFHLMLIERMLAVPLPSKYGVKSPDAEITQDMRVREGVFLNPSTLTFFLVQPLGLLFERALLVPLTNALPSGARMTLHRLWAWGFLLWSGRFWADAWVSGGMWSDDEGYVGWSPVRGLLYGRWWIV